MLELSHAARLASALSAFPGEPRLAALAVGLDLPRPELRRLEKLARAHFTELAEGKVGGVLQTVHRLLAIGAQLTADNLHLISPRDLPFALRNLAAVRDALIGDGGPRHGFTKIDVVLQAPTGEQIRLEPNSKDKAEGHA